MEGLNNLENKLNYFESLIEKIKPYIPDYFGFETGTKRIFYLTLLAYGALC